MERARALRPMGLGDILDETFDVYRGNILLFGAIAAVLVVPFTVFMSLLAPLWTTSPLGTTPIPSPGQLPPEQVQEQLQGLMKTLLVFVGVILVYAALYVVMTAALTLAVSERFLGRPVSMVGAYGWILRRLVSFILTYAAVGLLFLGAIVLMAIPIIGWIGGPVMVIVLLFWTALVPAVFVVEGRKYFAAVRRSRELAKGQWLRIFVLGLLAALISYIFQAVGSLVRLALTTGGVKVAGAYAAAGLFEGILGALAVPIPIIAWIVLYYDIRVRKEGFDLEMLARELAQEGDSAAKGASEA